MEVVIKWKDFVISAYYSSSVDYSFVLDLNDFQEVINFSSLYFNDNRIIELKIKIQIKGKITF